MNKWLVSILALIVVVLVVIPVAVQMRKGGGNGKDGAMSEVGTSAAPSFQAPLDKIVSVDTEQSPGGGRLTVQYGVMAVCDAAGIAYQFEKSMQLSGGLNARYIDPVNVSDITAEEAIRQILAPVGLKFSVDAAGLYLHQ